MTSKYQRVQPDDEKFHDVVPPSRSSTSTSDSTLLEDEEESRLSEPRRRVSSRWLWLGHAALLSLSFSMFAAAYFTPVSTLKHVQHFSAYCRSYHLKHQGKVLIHAWTAPAAKAVEYQTIKFNNTMGTGSPYVGKGPEVDKAWHAISYDSKYIDKTFSGYQLTKGKSEIKWSHLRSWTGSTCPSRRWK